jgi:hypothetical protein
MKNIALLVKARSCALKQDPYKEDALTRKITLLPHTHNSENNSCGSETVINAMN